MGILEWLSTIAAMPPRAETGEKEKNREGGKAGRETDPETQESGKRQEKAAAPYSVGSGRDPPLGKTRRDRSSRRGEENRERSPDQRPGPESSQGRRETKRRARHRER